MSVSDSARRRLNFLPHGVAAFLRSRCIEAAGALLLLAALALAVALASYHPDDPSLNAASGAATANWLGRPGAVVADLLLQLVGVAAALPAVLLALWGWRVAAHRGINRPGPRRVALVLARLALVGLGHGYRAAPDWPSAAGHGGLAGFYGHRAVATLLDATGLGLPAWVAQTVLAVIALPLLLLATAFGLNDWGRGLRGVVAGGRAVLRGAPGAGSRSRWSPVPASACTQGA